MFDQEAGLSQCWLMGAVLLLNMTNIGSWRFTVQYVWRSTNTFLIEIYLFTEHIHTDFHIHAYTYGTLKQDNQQFLSSVQLCTWLCYLQFVMNKTTVNAGTKLIPEGTILVKMVHPFIGCLVKCKIPFGEWFHPQPVYNQESAKHLTNCGLETSYGNRYLGQHWLR